MPVMPVVSQFFIEEKGDKVDTSNNIFSPSYTLHYSAVKYLQTANIKS